MAFDNKIIFLPLTKEKILPFDLPFAILSLPFVEAKRLILLKVTQMAKKLPYQLLLG